MNGRDGKIIIDNRSHLDDEVAVMKVLRVMREGKVSIAAGIPQYCFVTVFPSVDVRVCCTTNAKSYRFVVRDLKKEA